jgi:hypothetical protein
MPPRAGSLCTIAAKQRCNAREPSARTRENYEVLDNWEL